MWICANRKSGKKTTCKTGELHEEILRSLICDALQIKTFDESLIDKKLDHIDIVKKEKIIIYWKDGTNTVYPYQEKDRKAYYTDEIRKQISIKRKNKHQYKRRYTATLFTGILECANCGNSFTSQKLKRVNGEITTYLSCRERQKVCPKNSIKQDVLEELVCDVLQIQEFSEKEMDNKIERIYIGNNIVKFKMKDNTTIEKSYENKRPFVPWSEERRKQHQEKMKSKKGE